MSAYLVENKTIDRIVDLFFSKPYYLELLKDCDVNTDSVEYSKTLLGMRLFEMNLESLNYRYPDNVKDFIVEYYHQHTPQHGVMPIQYFKSISCYSYQSCEGECEHYKLYKAVAELQKLIALDIVSNLQEYRDGTWE